MKTTSRLTIIFSFLTTISFLVGCNISSESISTSQATSSSSNDSNDQDTPSGGSPAPGQGGSTGTTCYGDYRDGYDDGESGGLPKNPLVSYDIYLAGRGTNPQPNWTPGLTGYDPGIPSIPEALAVTSDANARLKVRLKILEDQAQPNCEGRDDGVAFSYLYTKLRFSIRLRPVNAQGQLMSPVHSVNDAGPIDVNSCSPIFDLPVPVTNHGFVVEIADVKSDSFCQYAMDQGSQYLEDYYCPAEQLVRSMDCWKGVLQISVDSTHDFR